MKKLSEEQMNFFLKNGEFPAEVTAAAANTAVVLTQDWCPQWTMMKRYLPGITGAAVFFIEYNREPRADEYMRAKETLFGNELIPYVRYYRNGAFAGDSNFVFKDNFLDFFKKSSD